MVSESAKPWKIFSEALGTWVGCGTSCSGRGAIEDIGWLRDSRVRAARETLLSRPDLELVTSDRWAASPNSRRNAPPPPQTSTSKTKFCGVTLASPAELRTAECPEALDPRIPAADGAKTVTRVTQVVFDRPNKDSPRSSPIPRVPGYWIGHPAPREFRNSQTGRMGAAGRRRPAVAR